MIDFIRHDITFKVEFDLKFFASQGPTHRLEINTPRDDLRMEDLSTDDEDRVHGQMKNYEKKIENLMSEMGSLKTEVVNL